MRTFPILHSLPVAAVLSAAFLPIISSVLSSQTVEEPNTVDTSTTDFQVDTSARDIAVDTSTGQVGDSNVGRSVPPAQPVPMRMLARMAPADTASKAKGEVHLSRVGDGMTVTGRIDGLEPNRRYALAVPPIGSDTGPAKAAPSPGPAEPEKTPQNDGVQRNDKDPATGAPAAGAPEAGTPQAPPPQAGKPGAGKPDGEERPGAPGAGEGTSVTGSPTPAPVPDKGGAKPGMTADANKLSGLLGIVTTDSAGGTNIDLKVRSLALTTGQEGLPGRPVTLTTIPAEGGGSVLVASGIVEADAAAPADK
ncbi:MAG: hypothetical protein EOP88_04705 [Verrucomicrobiaceae bacterium]|nr:MAG: hypothetical protein EOP88_04705 [Verrucomicrobiaceae bacterium]